MTFRDALGDISAPNYKYWCNKDKCNYTAVYLIQVIFFIEMIYMVIVLLNFLIAIISQSYEKVMNFSIMYTYQNKVELNKEYTMLKSRLPWFKMEEINLLILFSPKNFEDTTMAEWLGFVQTLKGFIIK